MSHKQDSEPRQGPPLVRNDFDTASGAWFARLGRALLAFARRFPFLSFFLLVALSNGAGSIFNIAYNYHLIVAHYLSPAQQVAFTSRVLPAYNIVAYAYCLAATFYLLAPLARCRRAFQAGQQIPLGQMQRCRRLLVNLPTYIVILNFLGWLPGTVIFPLGICLLGGWDHAADIWVQFFVSFSVSALLTSTQTFFFTEAYLIKVLYPDFFCEARPAEVVGAWRISFPKRLILFWLTVALVPLVALVAVALNFTSQRLQDFQTLRALAIGVAVIGAVSTGAIAWVVGRSLLSWVRDHAAATEQIALGHDEVRIAQQRPDEWGQLTDRFNDMAAALGRARHLRETFGQFLNPEVRDEILNHDSGLEGEVQEITVLFADIRGFTRRSEGETPLRTVRLLNRFLSLAVAAVEDKGGWVNKFLGDGVMALFGAPRPQADHADQAVLAALELLARLGQLNRELEQESQPPLQLGIGIHTGTALVGCIGATLYGSDGRRHVRREYTAIGETVNMGQRLEQLTKGLGGPVLVSGSTSSQLTGKFDLQSLGQQTVPGFKDPIAVYRLAP